MKIYRRIISALTAALILLSITGSFANNRSGNGKGAIIVTEATSVTAVQVSANKKAVNDTGKKAADADTKKSTKKEEPLEDKEKREADRIKQVLSYGLQKERKRALSRVLVIKTPAIQKDLISVLVKLIKNEPDAEVKEKAITVLGELKADEAVPNIVGSLDHSVEEVRIAAVYALQEIKATSTKNRLMEILQKQDLSSQSNFTESLIRCMGEFNAVEMIPLAKKAIEDLHTAKIYRELFVLMLGKIDRRDQGELLLKLLKDDEEDLTVRAYAANSLSKLGMKEAARDLTDLIKKIEGYSFKKRQRHYTLYIYSVAALARLGDPAAIPRLENALRSNSAMVRLKAVGLMKELKDKRTIDILKYKMEYDPSSKVRKAAREALREMGVEVKEEKEGESSEETGEEESE